MIRHNLAVRRALRECGVHCYELARHMGYERSYISKLLRNELTLEKQEYLILMIQEISQKKGL